MPSPPLVLIVEDNLGGPSARIREYLANEPGMDVELLHPSEATVDILSAADVVAVDHRLDTWEDRAAQHSIALQPMNGLALSAVFRSLLAPRRIGNDLAAFCLLTEHPEDLAGSSDYERRPQVLARSRDLEWVFSKAEPKRVAKQLASLAACVHLVKGLTQGSFESARSVIWTALGLDESEDLLARGWPSVERCQPPIVEVEEWIVPMSLVRWLLHRVIPYPGFLLDSEYLAARLRVTPESLRVCAGGESDFAKILGTCRYAGVLKEFDGDRWWAAAIDVALWEKREAGTISLQNLQTQLLTDSRNSLEFVTFREPVVYLDEKLESAGIGELADTVRLQPDDWPVYAQAPRAFLSSAEASARLRLLTSPEDVELLEDDEEESHDE